MLIKLVSALVDHGFVQSKYNDSLFVKDSGITFMALLVYVDNIVITGSNVKQIDDFKQFLKISSPLPENLTLNLKEGPEDYKLTNITNYQKLIGKLIYLTHTRRYISYSVHCLSQYMHAVIASHLKIALRVLRYLEGSHGCVEMFCDNMSALQLAANPLFHKKSKHFKIDLHLMREKISAGVIRTIKVHSIQ
ncbi:ribonuclease H-like domain-containing protein [Tanacetum coccineum]